MTESDLPATQRINPVDPSAPTVQTAKPQSPALGGRYALQSVVGRGGMGSVYVARDLVLERPVAVKVFRHDAAMPEQAARYEHEARILAALSHRGLVTVFDAGIDKSVADDPKPYLVMELVDGPTLADRLEDGPLPAAQMAAIGSQLGLALAYVHRRGIIHRDVKPANILLATTDEPDPQVVAKLTDFGIARLVDGARLTMNGLTLGTANYLSPEQVRGADVGPPSDVYSLGLVLLEGLTGDVSFPGHGVEAALARLHRPPVVPSRLGPEWAHLIGGMVELDPQHRPSAGQVAAGLSAVMALSAAPTLSERPPPPTRPPANATKLMQVPTPPEPIGPVRVSRPHPSEPVLDPVGAEARPGRALWLWAAFAIVLIGIAVVAGISLSRTSGPSGSPVPTYPSVSGQLGTDLHELERAVQP